jgi:very-short-patch-repair endonuclease
MTFAEEKYQWPIRNSDLARILGIKEGTLRQHQRNYKTELVEGEDYWRKDLGVPNAPTLMMVWSKEGAIKVARHCRRSDKARAFLQEMGVADQTVFYPEGRLLDIIESAMNGFSTCFRQYDIRGFRVDLYLRDLNIAIECDERDHEHRPKGYEEWRENEIEERLGCMFVRFNPNQTGFNIGKVINILFREIARRDVGNT